MKCASKAFYNRFLVYLCVNGLTPIEHVMQDEPLEIYRDREYICSFFRNGEIYFEHNSDDLNKISKFVKEELEL